MAIPVSELQKIAPSSIIELFELQLVTALHGANTIFRFHAGSNMNANGELVWNGNVYERYPIEADGFEYTGNGQLPRPKVRVSNIFGTITAILLTVNNTSAGNDLNGAKLTRIRTLARYIDGANFTGGTNPYGTPDPTAEFPREIYYLDRKVTENRDVVEFELAAAFDLAGVRAPKRQCVANRCQWVYRSTECSYAGPPIADANDVLLPGVTSSAEAVAYYAAKAAFDATVAPLSSATAALNTATNNLNVAQGNWYKAETRFDLSNLITQGTGNPQYAKWDNNNVSLGEIYRQGAERPSPFYGTGYYFKSIRYWKIERWAYDNSAVVAAQSAYNSALSTYTTAKNNYDTTLAARDAAFTAWQTSPPYANDLGGSGDECGKRLNSCKIRFGNLAELPFGSYPGVGTFFT
jgi:lambda family phage minor tail protein L